MSKYIFVSMLIVSVSSFSMERPNARPSMPSFLLQGRFKDNHKIANLTVKSLCERAENFYNAIVTRLQSDPILSDDLRGLYAGAQVFLDSICQGNEDLSLFDRSFLNKQISPLTLILEKVERMINPVQTNARRKLNFDISS